MNFSFDFSSSLHKNDEVSFPASHSIAQAGIHNTAREILILKKNPFPPF